MGDAAAVDALNTGAADGGYRGAILRVAETLAARPEALTILLVRLADLFAEAL